MYYDHTVYHSEYKKINISALDSKQSSGAMMMLPHAGENFSLTDSVSGLLQMTMRLLLLHFRMHFGQNQSCEYVKSVVPLFNFDPNPKIDFHH